MFREKMGSVQDWMSRVKLPRDLKQKIRGYYAEVGLLPWLFSSCQSSLTSGRNLFCTAQHGTAQHDMSDQVAKGLDIECWECYAEVSLLPCML